MDKTLAASGRIDYTALMKELEGLLGPVGGGRWNLVYEFSEGDGRAVTVTLSDDSIDAVAVQSILDTHVSEAGIVARAAAQELWETTTQPTCPKCGSHRWNHGMAHEGERAVQFALFGGVLLAIAAVMYLTVVPWSLVPVGLALFVLFQGALKWVWYAGRACRGCGYSTHDWFGKPPTRPG